MTFVELNISDTSVIKLGNRVANGVVVPFFIFESIENISCCIFKSSSRYVLYYVKDSVIN